MHLKKTPSPLRGPILALWLASQTTLGDVIRYEKYVKRNPVLRRQGTHVHTLSVSLLASSFTPEILALCTQPLDIGLILTGFHVHDLPEGLLRLDTHFIDKSNKGDVVEYKAFCKAYKNGPGWKHLHRAYLLQFALKSDHERAQFPKAAQTVMEELRKTHATEALVFLAIEAFDYIMYALECFQCHGDEYILTHVLRNQPGRLDEMVEKLPALRVMWTEELSRWCHDFVAKHAHIPVETKSN